MTTATLPDTMRHVAVTAPGGPDVLRLEEGPRPEPAPGEVLIRVIAAGVNRPDIRQREGAYPPPPGASPIIGLEIAGEVVALGEGVTGWRIGDRACALVAGGGYADYCTAPAPQCLPIPGDLSFVEAAALPETFFTVWVNVFERGGLTAGESILVHGGSSGIGTTAIQLAKAFGARVLATAGGQEKCAFCVALGADAAIDYRSEDFVAAVSTLTEGRGVDMVLDMVGGAYANRNLACLAPDGRLVQIATMQGAEAQVDLGRIMRNRLSVTGSTLRPRPVAVKAAIAAALADKVWPLLAARRLAPVIHKVFPLADVAEAHRLMETSRHLGKIVLQVRPGG
ncbi:Phthiocerol synthesis polyketide synthase type I PpsC [bacterium YEK0313]|nr:Phthiocerol synthesis polyketide synthase type I PpsC [bacterium YEK0313]